MKRKFIYTCTAALSFFLVVEASVRYSSQPPENYTGAEGSTCAQCHGNFNTGGGGVSTSGLPSAGFSAGEQYDFSVSIAHPSTRGRWGFSISARDANNQPVGSFSSTNPNAAPNGKDLSHFNAVLQMGTSFTYNNLKWTAPANPTPAQQTVKFYYVGNAANADFGNSGDFIYSGTLTTIIIPDNIPPVVTITEPANGASLPAGGPITMHATATDSDGSIAKVEFYYIANGIANKLGEDLVSPYELTGNDVEPGLYRVIAKATDNESAVGVSDTVNINITACTGSGSISVYGYLGIAGALVSNLTSHPNYPNNPDLVTTLPAFEYGPNITDNYGGRVRGYICAPQTGNYTFYLASDEQSELWLSTNEDPVNIRRIAFLNQAVGYRSWLTYTSQRSAPIRLIRGARYYIETKHKEGTGADHLSVGWVMPNGGAEGPIPGSRLSPFVAPLTSAANFNDAMVHAEEKLAPAGLVVTASPNPSAGKFNLVIESKSNETVSIVVTDLLGRVVEQQQNLAANKIIMVGERLVPGTYFAVIHQGTGRRSIKLIRK